MKIRLLRVLPLMALLFGGLTLLAMLIPAH
jgi:hypothetical protein